MTLKEAWEKRSKLYAEGSKLNAEADKLWAEGRRLWTEGSKLNAEGDLIYINTVIELHGPKAEINWNDGTVTIPETQVRP